MQRCKLPPTARAVSKQLLLPNGRGLVRIPRRSFADAVPSTTTGPVAPKRNVLRRILLYSTLATGTFYIGSTFVSFNSRVYHDFFVENVPLGTSVLQFAEDHDWDELDLDTVSDGVSGVSNWVGGLVAKLQGKEAEVEKKAGQASAATRDAVLHKSTATKDTVLSKSAEVKDAVSSQASAVASSASKAKDVLVAKAAQAKESVKAAVAPVTENVKAAVAPAKEKVTATTNAVVGTAEKAEQKVSSTAQAQANQYSADIQQLVSKAEHILAGKPLSELLDDVKDAVTTPTDVAHEAAGNVYSGVLPVGFEPPPGFARPAPPKPKAGTKAPADGKQPKTESAPPPLPLIAPAVAQLGAAEPVITQLAGTIDTLASYLNSVPTASDKARAVLSTAQVDLEALAGRVEAVRKEETDKLEKELEKQATEYNSRVIKAEMEAQDRIDTQEESFRKILDDERKALIAAYREKLEKELATQSEIIDQRLKEEVIAQGIELQRRWIREIKVRVEAERGGRLARLDELAASLKKLESVALDNAAALDDTVRAHALWSALRAVHHAVDAPVRRPFRAELRVLRAAAGAKEDPVVQAALNMLEQGECADVGVEPLGALSAWFASGVVPRLESVALVPDVGAGLLSHLASHLVSTFRFKRTGLVEGNDVLSVLARAEHYLAEKDLDAAAREVNQLGGVAKELASDWMDAARRRLEVTQALDVLQSQATVTSLLVV